MPADKVLVRPFGGRPGPTPGKMPAPREPEPFWERNLTQLLGDLGASERGLSSEEAREGLVRYGPNQVGAKRRWAAAREVISFLVNPLVVILLLASIISLAVGDVTDAGIVVLIVLMSLALNFVQAYRSQRAADELRRLVRTHATTLRDGKWQEIPILEIVPGDVVRLSAGDLVPADGRLLEEKDLSVNQSALTGESFPAEKSAGELPQSGQAASIDQASNAVFMGTSVVTGTGVAIMVRTGAATEFGRIGAGLRVRPPDTEFERGTRRFGLLISRTVAFLVVFVFLLNTVRQRAALEAFLFAVALAVGLTPEFLPMIVSVTLSRGALRMARKRVIVKHLPSIENFGSMDILCTDKTGTITAGEIELCDFVNWRGEPSSQVLDLGCLNSLNQAGIESPLDRAILNRLPADLPEARKLDEIPFDFMRRRLSVVLDRGEGEPWLVTKGAPEGLLPICRAVAQDSSELAIDANVAGTMQNTFEQLSAQGSRLLAVAFRRLEVKTAYGADDERDLTLAGFLVFADPPGATVAATLAELRQQGIEVKILTGDNELVAKHVCREVGLDETSVLLGSQLDGIADEALAHLAERTTLFARVSPNQKNRILSALKARGHVVGFMGDGINDAPSLRAADVGISVANAVDVAKEAADIILLEQSLQVLLDGVIEGRKSFENIMKYVLMGTSSNFGNMFSMAGASIFLTFLPMLPSQILLNNFLYDLSQVTIPGDNVDVANLQKPRRWNVHFIQLFMVILGPISSIYDFLTFFVLLQLFRADETLFHTGWFVESLATQTLVIFIIRTRGNPLRSRPAKLLVGSVLACVAAGVGLPFSPLAAALGFDRPPPAFFGLLVLMVGTYLLLVQAIKPWFYRRARL